MKRWVGAAAIVLVAACSSHSGTVAGRTPSPTVDPLLVRLQPEELTMFCYHVLLLKDEIFRGTVPAKTYRDFQQLDDSRILDRLVRQDVAALKLAPDIPTGSKQVQALFDRCTALGGLSP